MPRERMTELLKIAYAQQSNNGIANAENNCAQRVLLFRIEGDCTTGEREQGDRQPYFGVIVQNFVQSDRRQFYEKNHRLTDEKEHKAF